METIKGIFKIKMNQYEIINRLNYFLINEKGDINVKIKGGSLLHKATLIPLASVRNPVIEYLLDKNIDVNMKNENGRTPLFRFIYHNNNMLTNRLLDMGADLNVIDNSGGTILDRMFWACDNLKTFKRVIESLDEINIKQESFNMMIRNLTKKYGQKKVEEELGITKLLRYWI